MYRVHKNDFHGGEMISKHTSIKAALKSALKHDCTECKCGGPVILGQKDGCDIRLEFDYFYSNCGYTKAEAIEKAWGVLQ